MDLLNDWVSESILYAMGWTLVHSLWQLVILGAGLWLMLKLFRKKSAAFKYNLGLAALSLSVFAAFGTFIYEVASFTPTPIFERINRTFIPAQTVEASSSIGMEEYIYMTVGWIELQLPLLVNFWFLGALLFLFRLFNSLSEVRTLRKSSSDPEDFQLEKILYRLMGKMNISKKVELRLTSYGVSPITFGFLKPIILIPAGLILQLTPVQLEAIIAHELAHVKRNDYLVNLFQSALEVLFFYHPCYWWMNQTVKELRENAADDVAVKVGVVPKELAHSLAEVLNFAKQNPPELALAAGKRRNPTLQRIKRILGHPAQTYPQNPIISIPMLLTLVLSAGLMATAQQDVAVSVEKTKPLSVDMFTEVKPIVEVEKKVNTTSALQRNVKSTVDTIDSKRDTIIFKNSKRTSYTHIQNGDTLFFKDIPVMDLAPAPAFPAEAMAPKLDFAMAPFPPMDFAMAPIPGFDMGGMPVMDFMVYPPITFDFEGNSFSPQDTINMTKAEKAKWSSDMEKRTQEYAIKMKEWEIAMQPKLDAFQEKMAEWQKGNEPKMEEYQAKMSEWQKAMKPKMEEFEKKMEAWQKANEPKMKEFEAKMKAWQDENEPRMKEYEAKMKAWEKEMQPKMEEFQRKMEIWQKENAAKIEEYQKKLDEELKKKNNNK